jgi:hypothetical protein
VDYGTALPIPDDVKSATESYRADWRAFCGDAKSGRPSMADLLVKARALQERRIARISEGTPFKVF